MPSPTQPSSPTAATRTDGPHHHAINEILRQLNAGPPDGMTVTDITAGQSTYARSTIASAATTTLHTDMTLFTSLTIRPVPSGPT